MKRRGGWRHAGRVRSRRSDPTVVIFCNTGLRNAELRRAPWHQVDFLEAESQVGKAKTEGSSEGRFIPLIQARPDEAVVAGSASWVVADDATVAIRKESKLVWH